MTIGRNEMDLADDLVSQRVARDKDAKEPGQPEITSIPLIPWGGLQPSLVWGTGTTPPESHSSFAQRETDREPLELGAPGRMKLARENKIGRSGLNAAINTLSKAQRNLESAVRILFHLGSLDGGVTLGRGWNWG